MYKVVAIIMLAAFFLISQNIYALNLNLQSIDQEFSEAILVDRDTGDTWIAMEGDTIQEWLVIEINENSSLSGLDYLLLRNFGDGFE